MEQTSQNLFDLQIDPLAQQQLAESARWAKFLAILGFIGCGLMIIGAVTIGSTFSTLGRTYGNSDAAAVGGTFITILYVAIGIVYFFPCLFTFNFASKMQAALRSNDQDMLVNSLRNLKNCYRFLGILAIIGLCFFALGLLAGLMR